MPTEAAEVSVLDLCSVFILRSANEQGESWRIEYMSLGTLMAKSCLSCFFARENESKNTLSRRITGVYSGPNKRGQLWIHAV